MADSNILSCAVAPVGFARGRQHRRLTVRPGYNDDTWRVNSQRLLEKKALFSVQSNLQIRHAQALALTLATSSMVDAQLAATRFINCVWGSLLASSSLGCVSRNDFPGSTVAVSGDKNHADSRESSGDGLVPAKYLREDLRRVT
ncbi:uncharacterized protein FFMR_07003 [Fusarium fujikuroi]|nr:uncharacterized protein FFC1_05332 [Fusarium fujikuroi]SCO42843.1 uncharacterized protein FFMR_07003 [Fusarium fujikuroi]